MGFLRVGVGVGFRGVSMLPGSGILGDSLRVKVEQGVKHWIFWVFFEGYGMIGGLAVGFLRVGVGSEVS